MNRFEIQDNQYSFPYHYIMYGNYPQQIFSRHLWYKTATDVIVDIVNSIHPKSLLDVGCGDGCLLKVMSSNKEIDLYGADMSQNAILLAQAINPSVNFICDDFNNIEKKFDCITCIEVIEHISDELLPTFIKGLSDKLNENGKLIVSVPTIARPVHPKHFRHYDLNLLQQEFSDYAPDLKIESVKYMNKENSFIAKYSNHRKIIIPWIEKRLEKFYLKNCLFGDNAKDCIRMLAVLKK